METESVTDRSVLCEKLNMKLVSRPGSLELIERGVLEVEPDLKDIIKSGEVSFRRVSSDETDNSGSSPSMKILKHQEALDEVTARRLSLAAQQQRQVVLNQDKTLSQISEQGVSVSKPVVNKSCSFNPNTSNITGNTQRSLVTGQISRFKGLVFHNYCPAGSKENQEIREQQQEKYIQLQEARNFDKTNNSQSSIKKDQINYPNKCARCSQTPDRVSSLNDLTVAQLKTECRLRSLPRSGNKSSLIATLTPFKEEIIAIENACSHITTQTQFSSNHSSSSKLQMNDRSISLPTEYYENIFQEPLNNLVTPLTFNVTCFSGSISDLSFGSYPILIRENNCSDAQNLNTSDNFNTTTQSSDISTKSPELVNMSANSDLQHQMAMDSSSMCYSNQAENNPQMNNIVFHPPTNPLLFYKLPTFSSQEPAFIQTNGLEMIQLVQQELLRNIECLSQIYSDQEPEIPPTTLQHQRYVLVNFLNQLIQKTPAFNNCNQLINDQQKINQWINNCSSFDYQIMSQVCMDNSNANSSQSFLAYLHQQPYSSQPQSDPMMQYGENDLLNLITEVVTEEEMKTNAENVHKEIQRKNLSLHQDIKPPNSPMQTDSPNLNEKKSVSKSNSNENSRGVDQKRAAWLQKVSPRLYKATSNNANSELPFSAFNFDFSGGSLLSGCGSRTSSEGCGSINSSITDAQILSPGTEKVLFETIFQHTNSGSSMENDIFNSTMNMEDVSSG